MLCRCVCVKESVYERESGERKVSWSVGQLVERSSSLFWVFLVPSFAPKKSFFFKSVVSFSLVVCVFFALFDVFVSRCTWIEKSASNVERSKRNALESF